MKALTNLINKVGIDKVLHFAIGAIINALLYPFGIEYTVLCVMVVFILSCVKELFDSFEEGNKCDWIDVLYSVLGAIVMSLYYYLIN